MDTLWQDWRLALRSLRRSAGFTTTVVCTLALGIGATTSVFSVAYAVLLKPLPIRDPERVVALWAHNPLLQPEHVPLNFGEYKAFAHETGAFQEMAAYEYHGTFPGTVRFGDTAATVSAATVTGNFFDVLGVHPRLGRLLRPSGDLLGGPVVGVISDRLWFRAFGNDPAFTTNILKMAGRDVPIVSVVPGVSTSREAPISGYRRRPLAAIRTRSTSTLTSLAA